MDFALSCFLLFALSSSAIYLLNDCLDVEYDRKHPIKRNRPIAAGLVSRNFALLISILLIIFCVSSAFFIKKLLAGLICLYILIQISYCIKLKKEPLLDIFCLAAGFLIRATSGAVATGLFISPWFLLSTGLLALFLATEKRKAELKHSIDIGKIEREVLKRYSLPLLNRLENIVATSTFVSYMLWASGPVLNGAKSSLMLFTVPLVLIGIFRYQMLTDQMK